VQLRLVLPKTPGLAKVCRTLFFDNVMVYGLCVRLIVNGPNPYTGRNSKGGQQDLLCFTTGKGGDRVLLYRR
jgi:hypothetical protein